VTPTPNLNPVVIVFAGVFLLIETAGSISALTRAATVEPVLPFEEQPQRPQSPSQARDSASALEAFGTAPLFNPRRSPPPPPPEPPPPPPPPPEPVADDVSDVTIVAILRVGPNVAALVKTGTGETVKLKPGQVFRRWTIDNISEDGLFLKAKDETRELLTRPPKADASTDSAASN
jgi:hypothetical protein